MAIKTFTPGIGRLTVDRYDFQHHIDGYSLQHNADAIILDPQITVAGTPKSNVYTALSTISGELTDLAASGKGFTLIGDGYDTYHNSIATPDSAYDAAVPAFNTYLNDVLNNPTNPLYFRIRSGGIVVIKAGTYKFTGTVNVPPGIILMGEGYGTKIVNQTNGTIPLFKIKKDQARISDAGIDATDYLMFARETMLLQMVIADNFPEPKYLGDLSYKTPISGVTVTPYDTNPLVMIEDGASLTVEKVKFIGKTTYTLGTLTNVTTAAIATDTTVPSGGTRLKVLHTSIDGVAQAVIFNTTGKKDSNLDITGCLVKAYGFNHQNTGSAQYNAIFYFNNCNANIVNNYVVGSDTNVTTMNYINPSVGTVLQGKCKMIIANNNAAVARTSSSVNSTFKFVTASTSFTVANILVYGNNFTDRGFNVSVDNEDTSPKFRVDKNYTYVTNDNAVTIQSNSNNVSIQGGQSVNISGTTGISVYSGEEVDIESTTTFGLTSTGAFTLTSYDDFTATVTKDLRLTASETIYLNSTDGTEVASDANTSVSAANDLSLQATNITALAVGGDVSFEAENIEFSANTAVNVTSLGAMTITTTGALETYISDELDITAAGGTIFRNGIRLPVRSVSASTSLDAPGTFADYFIAVDTNAAAGATTITLPIGSFDTKGRVIVVKDSHGFAGTKNITISSADLIDGAGTAVISTNYGSVKLVYNFPNGWAKI